MKTESTSETLKDHAKDLAEKTQDAMSSRARAHADQAKSSAAAQVEEAASAAHAAAAELDPSSPQAEALQQVADAVDGVAQQLRQADVGQVVNQISAYARQNPALFVGGAALAGLALGRFLKARKPIETASAVADDPWQQTAAPAAPNLTSRGAYHG